MKKILLIMAAFLALWEGVLFGQEAQKPYSCKFEKGIGECIFTSVSLDEVWTTAVKVLMLNKYRIVSAEKQSSVINAEVRPFVAWNYDLSLYFEQRGKDVSITASVLQMKKTQGDLLAAIGHMGIEKQCHEEEKKFFDKVVELLYEGRGK